MGLDVIWLQKGTVPLPSGLSAEGGVARLEEALIEEGVYAFWGTPDGLEFETNVFFPRKPFGWRMLQPFNRGQLQIGTVGGKLVARYRFSLMHLFCFCLFGAALMGLFAASHSPSEGAKVAALTFGFLYGGNYLLGAIFASSFVGSALHEGEAEYFSAGEKIGCLVILGLILALWIWLARAAFD